jgi:hypothetical protein
MAAALESEVFTSEITNSSLTITPSMGVQKLSVYNGTTTAGTILGNRTLGATTSSALNIAEGETVTVTAIEASVIDSLVITAPSGCTLKIIAQ